MALYRFLAVDLRSMIVREEIPFQNVKFSDILNRPGSFSASTSLSRKNSASFDPLSREVLSPGNTAIFVERSGVIVWSGILWTMRINAADQTIEYGAEGFLSYLRRRTIKATQEFASVDQCTIAQNLVTYAQSIAGGNLGFIVGTETSGVLRDRTYYYYERKPIGEALEQLSEVIDGFDFSLTSAWNGNVLESSFAVHYPKRGGRTDLVLDLDKQISNLEMTIDATVQANSVSAIGEGEGDQMLVSEISDPASLTAYPLLEETLTLKDVSVPATLEAHARARLTASATPIETIPSATFRPQNDLEFGSFICGDEIRVIAKAGWLTLDSFYRIVSWDLSLTNDGAEEISLSFAEAEAFGE